MRLILGKAGIKGVSISNEDFISQKVKDIVKRDDVRFPGIIEQGSDVYTSAAWKWLIPPNYQS
ncbi:MAG: hypothetical protein ACUVWO_17960 [Thermodesulfobacteriota bacterium]